MQLEHNYYTLSSMHTDGLSGIFHVELLADCDVYRGHFPGHPVCPGVLNIQLIRDCAERLVGKRLHICTIRQCRMLSVATPTGSPRLDVRVDIAPVEVDISASQSGYQVCATVTHGATTYIQFKGEMTA